MPKRFTSISIFLSSPSDVSHERGIITNTIQSWNDRIGQDRGVLYQVLKWETSVSAGFASDGQEVINNQVGDDYDILIALFWKTIGSPTPRARSGTIEEFEKALERHQSNKLLDIGLFFKTSTIDFRSEDLDKLSQVKSFEK